MHGRYTTSSADGEGSLARRAVTRPGVYGQHGAPGTRHDRTSRHDGAVTGHSRLHPTSRGTTGRSERRGLARPVGALVATIAQPRGVCPHTVRLWLKRFNAAGNSPSPL